MLWEVMYQREGGGTTYFELLRIQYFPIHNEFIENIETQVAEVLTKFGEGNTVVMLQFRTQDVPFKTSFTKMKKKMRGGSLTGFLPDKSQYGSRVFTDMLKGGLKVLKTLETP